MLDALSPAIGAKFEGGIWTPNIAKKVSGVFL